MLVARPDGSDCWEGVVERIVVFCFGELEEGGRLSGFGAVFIFPRLIQVSFGGGYSVGRALADGGFV